MIGAPDNLRDYMIENLNAYVRSPANQFAAKLATGGGAYSDLQNWSYFKMEDWRAGTNKKDPEGGGFLYGELETRFPNRLTLPNALSLTVAQGNGSFPLNDGWQPGRDVYPNSTLEIGTTKTVQRIAHAFNGISSDRLYVTLWLSGTPVTSLTVALYSSTTSGGRQVPNTLLASTSFYPDGVPGERAYSTVFTETLSGSTYYHIVIYPTTAGQSITLPVTTSGVTAADEFSTYDGSSWTGGYTSAAFLHGVFVSDIVEPILPFRIAAFDNNLYTIDANNDMWHKTATGNNWIAFDTADDECTDMIVIGDELWIAQGSAQNIITIDKSETVDTLSVPADLLVRALGYVWRSVGGDVYYTNDGTTWDGPIEVAWGGIEVRAMAPLGDFLYCATDDGLYYIGYANQVGHVTDWPSIDASNGVGMINHQGTLFIPVQQSLYRFDGQSMIPVGLDMDEGLPQDRLGTVAGLISLNSWLVAYVRATENEQRSTVWAYNDQGWHYLAGFPYGIHPEHATYDINTKTIHFITTQGLVWQLPIQDSANFNNISAYPMPKMPSGWLETDWFFGDLYEVLKDCESLYASGDGIDSTHTVKLYWKDDDSTNWELLGTVDSGREEIRWSDYTTRPDTRQIKIGVLLSTQDVDAPVVRVIRMKYHPMVSDWYRWSFPILCSDYQELLGAEMSPWSREEQEEHLDALIKQRHPFILQDVSGKLYEVKVMGCQIQVGNYQYRLDGVHYDAIYNITVEQIRSAEYGD